MSRGNRGALSNNFLSGGVYNANEQFQQQQAVAVEVNPTVVQEKNVEVALEQDFAEADVVMEPSVKAEPIADDANNSPDNGKRAGKTAFIKTFFLKRKKSSVRLKEKKLRQNRQLRKALLPKNALMALHEVKGVVISDFVVTSASNNGFSAIVTVNDKQYEGKGPSKMTAKNDACEKALRDYVIEKMRQHPRNMKKSGTELMETTENNIENGSQDNADDVPMINLASFALFKLFSNWESEGFKIPELRPGGSDISGNVSNVESEVSILPSIRNELPDGWQDMHPATLLCLMRPGLTYKDTPAIGEFTKLQNVYVIVDDIRFDGIGRSKKIARRNAAALACNQMFGTNFLPLA